MATYIHGSSEFQAAPAASDGMQTLYLMNPNYVPYSDTHQPATATNMFFLNPAGNSLNPISLPHAPPSNYNHFLGLPLPSPTPSIGPSDSDEPNRPPPLVSGVHHNLWGSSIDQQNSSPGSSSHPQLVSAVARAGNSGGPLDVISQLGLRWSGVSSRQGLSLSLSSLQVPYRSSNVETVIQGQPEVAVPPTTSLAADDMRISGSSPSTVSVVSNGISGVQSVVLGSKYLRAVQELLDEVVKVGKGKKTHPSGGTKEKTKAAKTEPVAAVNGDGSSAGENGVEPGPELTTAQRQELQMKKAKLVNMLDEVEQRYRQYHHQMQMVVASFEQAAGLGAAKSYTALALQTISKQFRCLKDAISCQIKATNKSLGEEDCLGVKMEGSRLRYVDNQIRQQRALQQLGMIQHHNAWRPQRGLPERAVCVLRAWLFEHFLHPYPKDSDKHMLAKQTGLTRSQVSNWFINARVRLWKPMVEEMYMEEIKEQERNTNGSEEINADKNEQQMEPGSYSGGQTMDQVKAQSKPSAISQNNNNNITFHADQFSNSTISTSPMGGSLVQQTSFNLIGSSDLDRSPKKPRNKLQNPAFGILPMEMEMEMKQGETREINMRFGDERLFKDHSYSYLSGTVYSSMREVGRFNHGQQLPPGFPGNSGVSLTLGLPHCENLSLSGNHQNFVPNQNINDVEGATQSDFCAINTQPQPSHSTTYDTMEMQSRKRFAAPLLPDFVA
ncbi:hypothetical protein ERO13_A05G078000v2 [Gossypium hirsutum]|uniref:BEL1-like homeodomain protein 1 n=1 Tax=Gossypium hirsutum TaxID=3635 RepID=A0ABM3BPT4_GOSHI|nr:BEL1-like homeodomain protein 1 [Gossypium hirsutum]XP_040969061.1 BEL1-like homeodomain protein 1 [Gossypium hirsutum]KAG4198320.1 hypothetical protein ERO13_A05G078000v2 [Gossypium hirsutum]KAG4198321.1 hypothetical protein ERO13_A05G078000v2 [Gossypium hirsutum]